MSTLAEYDRALAQAIDQLAVDYGPVDAKAVDDAMGRIVAGFGGAAVDDRIPEGVLFDAKRERRKIAFHLAYQRLVDELLESIPDGVTVHGKGGNYSAIRVRDRLTGDGVRALVAGNRFVLGAEQDNLQPGGRYRWAIDQDRFKLVDSREQVRAAITKLAEQRQRGSGHDGLG